MAWLQSPFTNHQLIGENKASNLRKGYKVGSLDKNTDPDNSDTPLLLDGPLLDLRSEADIKDSCDKASFGKTEPKKPNLLQNLTSSKPSFLSSNFFDRGTNVIKTKPLPDIHSPTPCAPSIPNTAKDAKNLLGFGNEDKPREDEDEEDEEDSDDDWFSPYGSRGYQKVKTGAD